MIYFKDKIKNSTRGSSMIEFVFYLSIFAILVLVTINAIIMMTKSFRETTVQATLESGGVIMERLSREVKQALSITSLSATDLTLVSKDQSGNSENVQFVLSGSDINFLQNGVLTGTLNSPNLAVSNLSFTRITTNKGTAVKISFSVGAENDPSARIVDFYNTVVLRGDY